MTSHMALPKATRPRPHTDRLIALAAFAAAVVLLHLPFARLTRLVAAIKTVCTRRDATPDEAEIAALAAQAAGRWSVEARRTWLLRSAEDVLATTTEISRALTRYAQPVTPSAIRGYVDRGQLVAKGGTERKPLYRLGDVLDIVARQAERATA